MRSWQEHYLFVFVFKRELVAVEAGTFIVGGPFGLLKEPWPLTGFIPVLRTMFPLPSLTFEMPFCACDEVSQATRQTTTNHNFM